MIFMSTEHTNTQQSTNQKKKKGVQWLSMELDPRELTEQFNP